MARSAASCLLAILMAFTPGPVDGRADDISRCSISTRPGMRGRAETILLAKAAADTVLVGSGSIEPSPHGGHSGPGGPGPIHGQVFEVERFSGADSVLLAGAFRDSGNARVLIVPWDYDASCQPARWTRGARWVSTAGRGVFTLQLRPDSLWMNGMPVFDAFLAVLEPYPLSGAYGYDRSILQQFRSSARMSADQYFALLSVLRPSEDIQDQPDSVWSTYQRWQRDHPDLIELYPANAIALILSDRVSRAKARRVLLSIDPVIAGTFRMTAALDGQGVRSFYVRTRPRPMNEWRPNPPKPLPGPLDEPERPDAYMMLATGAPTLDMLATDCRAPGPVRPQGYVYVIDPPPRTGESRKEWRGWIESGLVARQFPEDSAYARFHRQAFAEWSRRWRAGGDLEAPARYWLDDDGNLRVEQTTTLADGRTLTVTGERVAAIVVSCES